MIKDIILSKKSAQGGNDAPKVIAKSVSVITEDDAKAHKPKKPKDSQSSQKTNTKAAQSEKLYLRVRDSSDSEILMDIKQIVEKHPGKQTTILVLGDDNSKQAVKLPQKVDLNDSLTSELSTVLHDENVVIA